MKNKELHMRLVKPLRARRKFFKITQAEMAEKLGHKSSAYIALIEKGERNLDVGTYVIWREALGMSLNFLHDFEELSEDWKRTKDPFGRVKEYGKSGTDYVERESEEDLLLKKKLIKFGLMKNDISEC